MALSLKFHGDLPTLLRRPWRDRRKITRPFARRASVKDVVESFGLPHTEVGRLLVNGQEADFSFQVLDGLVIEVFPVTAPWHVFRPGLLRPEPLTAITFVVDVNVGKLARLLRMVGFDTAYDQGWNDEGLAVVAERERRILLSKDRGLLSRKRVEFGRYVRAEEPREQLREVVGLLGLGESLAPFSRCMACNGVLRPVAKGDIIDRLQPLTRKYYTTFSICPDCRRIYWPGSHLEKMEKDFLDRLHRTGSAECRKKQRD